MKYSSKIQSKIQAEGGNAYFFHTCNQSFILNIMISEEAAFYIVRCSVHSAEKVLDNLINDF
jgi:hypothetical protein